MSNIISKIRQRIAVKEKNKFDLSCDHITTSDFFKILPVYFKELVPGENISITQSTFTRLSPMVNPMYGRCRIVNRAFFVPMRTIFKGWNEFITDVPFAGKFLQTPLIDPYDLAYCFKLAWSTEITHASGANDYDFCGIETDDTTKHYYRFNKLGRRIWSLICSLGYRFPIGYYCFHTTASDSEKFSALPLLAYAKIYKDWYHNLAYTTTVFDGLFDISYTTTGTPSITGSTLILVLNFIDRALYDKDYFTSAWDRPVSPNNGLSSSNNIPDITNLRPGSANAAFTNSHTVNGVSTNESTPALIGTKSDGTTATASPGFITLYALDALKSLTDYLKRHQIAGGLAMDRMLTRFGVKPSDAKLDRCVYIGKNEVEVQIADVMATSNGTASAQTGTKSTTLGDYAGKGIGFNDGVFNFETDEYGYLIIISVILPKIGYVQGCSRYNLHKNRLDFFTPEFDSLGVLAISRRELMSDYNGAEDRLVSGSSSGLSNVPDVALNGVFGFTSRYAEYKTQLDNLTGDFTVLTAAKGLDSWHLNRIFDPQTVDISDLTHNEQFTVGETDQYDRVFAYLDSNYDHFYNIHHFDIVDYAPMSKMFDDYEFDGGKEEVSIEVNGTQLN